MRTHDKGIARRSLFFMPYDFRTVFRRTMWRARVDGGMAYSRILSTAEQRLSNSVPKSFEYTRLLG